VWKKKSTGVIKTNTSVDKKSTGETETNTSVNKKSTGVIETNTSVDFGAGALRNPEILLPGRRLPV
jgi:hypothetical protein